MGYDELEKLHDDLIFELEVVNKLARWTEDLEDLLKKAKGKIENEIDEVLEAKIRYREKCARSTEVETFFERIENVMGYPRKESK